MKRLLGLTASLLAALTLALPASAAPTVQALPGWTTNNSTWENPRAHSPMVTDLTYATHSGFDRVVITIDGRIPGWKVTSEHRFFRDGSGTRVPIRGGLQVALNPARAHNNSGHSVYGGPMLVRPMLPTLKAIAMTGDFEGYVTFAFGLDPQRSAYRIFRLNSPQRIVIDFKH
jgi:hypothetical protein